MPNSNPASLTAAPPPISSIDKGHTEGLEPHVVEEIVKLMVAAK